MLRKRNLFVVVAMVMSPALAGWALAETPSTPTTTTGKTTQMSRSTDSMTQTTPTDKTNAPEQVTTIIVDKPLPIPELLEEDVPLRPSDNQIWVPGYWERAQDWTWIPGQWMTPPHKAAHWLPGHWNFTGTGWQWMRGQWVSMPGFFVEEAFIYDMSLEPSHAFAFARTNLDQKHPELAAHDIRAAARFIRMLANREAMLETNVRDRVDLRSEADTLDQLARNLADGSITSDSKLDKAYAQAEVALARHYRVVGMEEANVGHTHMAGQALHSAVFHLEMALADSNLNAQKSVSQAMETGEQVATKLIDGNHEPLSAYRSASKDLNEAINHEFGSAQI